MYKLWIDDTFQISSSAERSPFPREDAAAERWLGVKP